MPTEALFALGMLKLTSLMLAPALRPLQHSLAGLLTTRRTKPLDLPTLDGSFQAVHGRTAQLSKSSKEHGEPKETPQTSGAGVISVTRRSALGACSRFSAGSVSSLSPTPRSWTRRRGCCGLRVVSPFGQEVRPRSRAMLATRLVLARCGGGS